MYEYKHFHESYYNHSCSIIPEKDVLDIDIEGAGFSARFTRWWHDLFLVSYKNERSRTYYTSSHAIRMERMRQFRNYRNRIHPLSKFRNFWDCLILIVFIVNKMIFHFTSTILYDQLNMSYYYLGGILDGIIIIDLYFALKTGFIDPEARTIVLDLKRSIMKFCSTQLFIYVASAVPLNLIMFIRLGKEVNCGLCKSNHFFCALKAISVFSLYRVYEASAFLAKQSLSGKRSHVYIFLRIVAVGFLSMMQVIDFSDMISLLSLLKHDKMHQPTYFGLLIHYHYAVPEPIPISMLVSFDFVRICKSLLLYSFGPHRSQYHIDKVASITAFVLATWIYGWCVIECYALVSRSKYPEDKFFTLKNRTMNMLESRQLPDKVISKVERYFDFNLVKHNFIPIDNGLYRGLPDILKREVVLHCHGRLLMRIPFFKEWPPNIVEDLGMMLEPEVYLENDIVADAWVQGSGLTMVDVGMLAVYTAQHEEVGHMIDGDYFGEISLVTDKEVRTSCVYAITTCSVLVLKKIAFRKYMRQYPKLFFNMKQKIKKKYKQTTASMESLLSGNPRDGH